MKTVWTAMMAALICAGCAFGVLEHDNQERRDRIGQKQDLLRELEKENKLLLEKKWGVAKKLKGVKLDLHTLKDELDAIICHNKKVIQIKQGLDKDKKELEQSIQELEEHQKQKRKIVQLEQQALPVAEKKRRIEELKEEIRIHLLMGLKNKYRPGLK